MWSSDRCYSPAKRSLNVVRIFKESAAPSSPSRFNVEALIGRRRSQATTYSLPPHWTLERKGVSVRFSRIGHTNCVGKPARSGCCNPTKFGRERSAVEEYNDKFIRSLLPSAMQYNAIQCKGSSRQGMNVMKLMKKMIGLSSKYHENKG